MDKKLPTTSHAEALKSTAIIGGSTVIVMLIRIVRTKVMAILLGPAGIGLEAMFDSVTGMFRTAADLGISSSGVRQIASAAVSGDSQSVAATVFTLRRVCLLLGLAGSAALFLAREPVSRLAFGNADHAADIGLLSLILLFGGVMGGQGALLQGMRRIGDLARMNILAALAAAVLSIPIIFIWGREGIPAYMVLASAVGVLVSWHFASRVRVESVRVPLRLVVREAAGLFRLGLVFLSSGLMTIGSLFLLRVFVTNQFGVDGAGQFQAANALSVVYVGFVLQAMGTDFYPRLTAVADDDQRCNQLVNEQAEISLLLALPGVLATLALAPWLIQLLYSAKFHPAAEILCWQLAGMFLRVNSWPMGFIIMAKGRAAAIFWTELAAYSAYVGLGWAALRFFGLPGAGMAFLGLYIFHWMMTYAVVRWMSGFRWSPGNARLALAGAVAVAVTLWARLKFSEPWSTAAGVTIALVAGCCCLRTLAGLVGIEKIREKVAKARMLLPSRKPAGIAEAPELAPKG